MSPSRGSTWGRRQFLVKAEFRVLLQRTGGSGRVGQEGFTLWRKEVVEEREEESSVEVSQNREVQQSGGQRHGLPLGTRPGPLAGELAQTVQQKIQK